MKWEDRRGTARSRYLAFVLTGVVPMEGAKLLCAPAPAPLPLLVPLLLLFAGVVRG